MKTILIAAILLVCMTIQAQEYPTLIRWIEENVENSTVDIFYCHYTDDDELELIEQMIGLSDDIRMSYNYDNDTMYMRYDHIYDITTDYEYTPDTVYVLNNGDTVAKYTINDEYQIINGGQYTWDEGNCVAKTGEWTATFQEYRNPWLFAQLYFKGPWFFWGLANGSYYLQDKITFVGGNEYEMEVVQALDEWPYQIQLKKYGEVKKQFIIEYRDLISDTPEISIEPATVFSIDYYDIMGRKIEKPSKGFYIESKTTSNGIISKKYFIQ